MLYKNLIRTCLLLALSTLCISACSNYRWVLNDRVVYSPIPLLEAVELSDHALGKCINEHISRLGITNISQLEILDCNQYGIQSLDGINQFPALLALKLSHNKISDLKPLKALTELEELYLDNNQLTSIETLTELPRLKNLELQGNPGLSCRQLKTLKTRGSIRVEQPSHCK